MRFPLILMVLLVLRVAAHEPEAELPFERPHAHDSLVGHLHTGWESRYFSEGRDALDGDSLWASSVEVGWRHIAAGVWFGSSPDQDYDELQLTLAVTQTFGDFDLYAAYTHLRTPFDGAHDHELGAGVVWSGLPFELDLALDGYYSIEAEGSFWELALGRELEVAEALTLNVAGIFGINQGYVSDGHDGANHIALRVGAEYVLGESFALMAHAGYSWALDRDGNLAGDEQLVDFFHGGLGVQWSF